VLVLDRRGVRYFGWAGDVLRARRYNDAVMPPST
jgi:hypothetical protein